ncbi:MAG: biotin--[acetyl-CoA-carboxylase] ligase [Anaerolineae bacterium]|nr:biotin--[acetyl-CoA-carboxylase] ligase [Anaerolineae bacterium]
MASDLTPERLAAILSPRKFKFYEEIGSTNDVAREWADQGAPAGSVVLAELQTQGRGRFKRQWSAPVGSALLTSTVLRPAIDPTQLARVTMLGAVAVAETVESFTPHQVAIKWPNDVQLAGKKVAGILPEAEWRGDRCVFVILGIGLNVRIDFTDTLLEDSAISIETVTKQPVDRALLLNQLLQRIDHWSRRLTSEDLWRAWRERLSTLGQHVQATAVTAQTGGQISGQAVDVDGLGRLLIRDENDTIHHVVAGEVTLSL